MLFLDKGTLNVILTRSNSSLFIVSSSVSPKISRSTLAQSQGVFIAIRPDMHPSSPLYYLRGWSSFRMSSTLSMSEKPPFMTKFRCGKVSFNWKTQGYFKGGIVRFYFGLRPLR